MKFRVPAVLAVFVISVALMSCASAPEIPVVTVQVQYRVTSDYKPDTTAPKTRALARAHTFEKAQSTATATFELNGQRLFDGERGTYLRNDASIVREPYVLEWAVKDYQDSNVFILDTILAPITISDFSSGDTVSKSKGFSIQFTGVAGNDAPVAERVYGLIVGQNTDGTPLSSEDTRTMFDQLDDGQLEVTPGILSALKTHTQYKLLIERGRIKRIRQFNVDVVSNSFSEALTYFYLAE